MLTRIWAVLRTLYLGAVASAALWAMPWRLIANPLTDIERNAQLAAAYKAIVIPTWLAIGWIALEVAVGWLVVWRNAHADRAQLKKALKEAQTTRPPDPTGIG